MFVFGLFETRIFKNELIVATQINLIWILFNVHLLEFPIEIGFITFNINIFLAFIEDCIHCSLRIIVAFNHPPYPHRLGKICINVFFGLPEVE